MSAAMLRKQGGTGSTYLREKEASCQKKVEEDSPSSQVNSALEGISRYSKLSVIVIWFAI
jgi:hypothetical protein